jgi:hypothetical protein
MVTRSLCLLLLLALSASAQTPRIPPPEAVNRNGLVVQVAVHGYQRSNGSLPSDLVNRFGSAMQTVNPVSYVDDGLIFNGSSNYAMKNEGTLGTSVYGLGYAESAFTLSIKCRLKSLPASGGRAALFFVQSRQGTRRTFRRMDVYNASGVFKIDVLGRGTAPNFTPLIGRMHHYVLCRDAAGINRVYVDGVKLLESTGADEAGIGAGTDETIATIGAYRYTSGSALNYTDGFVKDFRIYNRALSADEIKRIYRGLQ